MASKISVVINTLNEEKNISRAILSVKKLADEVVVVDMESDDKTREIAKNLGAKIFTHKKTGYVEPARNFAIGKATGDWIFILDADEEVTPALVDEIKQKVNKSKADYFRLPRKNIIFGRFIKHSRWWPDMNIRLFRKGFVSWNEIIHTVPITQGRGEDFPEKEDLAIIHHNYDSVDGYLERMNRYTTHHARIKIDEGYKFSWKDVVVKPMGEFLSRYFYGQGYKDGLHGLALSLLQAFSEFSVYLKVWQAEKFESKDLKLSEVTSLFREQEKDLHYWESNAAINESGSLLDRIRRKLKI
jgi:(heptosyl)LPS beta-1,4-glucosyltransferase